MDLEKHAHEASMQSWDVEPPIPPCPDPRVNALAWPDVTIEAEAVRMTFRVPPALELHPRPEWRTEDDLSPTRRVAVNGTYLVESWKAKSPFGARFLAIWADRIASFTTWDRPSALTPVHLHFAKCTERISDVEVHIATWVTRMPEEPPAYAVSVHWPLGERAHAKLAAECFTTTEQRELLSMLRTLRIQSLESSSTRPRSHG